MSKWAMWDRNRTPPSLTDEQFRKFIEIRRKKIFFEEPFRNRGNKLKDKDWFEAFIGNEGDGKSQHGLIKGRVYDESFEHELKHRIVYSLEHLEDLFASEERGISILIDEAIFMAHSKRGQEKNVTRFEEDIISCRYLHNYIMLCVPELMLLTPQFRKRRLLSVSWCIEQGKVWMYDKPNYHRIAIWEKDQDPNYIVPKYIKKQMLPVPYKRPRPEYRYYPAELIENEEKRTNNRQIVSEMWEKYLKIKDRRNKERYKKALKIEGYTSGDVGKMFGVCSMTGHNYVKRAREIDKDCVFETPSGHLMLKKDRVGVLDDLFPRKS